MKDLWKNKDRKEIRNKKKKKDKETLLSAWWPNRPRPSHSHPRVANGPVPRGPVPSPRPEAHPARAQLGHSPPWPKPRPPFSGSRRQVDPTCQRHSLLPSASWSRTLAGYGANAAPNPDLSGILYRFRWTEPLLNLEDLPRISFLHPRLFPSPSRRVRRVWISPEILSAATHARSSLLLLGAS